ncbi:ABC transporter ATP-binding protein [Corynebacterium sp. L4756]|uniref:ABC transporter ATP-binding protein n=1 Tax=unclassified Corynebacterium TaxID=2624378 RepID=UPI00374D9158
MSTTFDGQPVLQVNDLAKAYGDKQAVNGLSFELHRGELLCLLGANGAGKTTTIEMCEGFIKPTSGRISVLGMDPTTQADDVRARVGIMLQGGGGYTGIKVKEMLKLAASYSANPHDPDWLIDILGLRGVANNSYRRLSGGQQQRLSLALAIIGRPDLVFLDEPTAGLDTQSRIAVWELVRALKRDGVAVVLTTHLMDEAEALADNVLIIDHGRKVAMGTPVELTRDAATQIITVTCNRDIDEKAFSEQAGYDITPLRPLHYRVHAEPSPQSIAKIAAELERQEILATHLETSHRNLEDVFLDITGRHLRS